MAVKYPNARNSSHNQVPVSKKMVAIWFRSIVIIAIYLISSQLRNAYYFFIFSMKLLFSLYFHHSFYIYNEVIENKSSILTSLSVTSIIYNNKFVRFLLRFANASNGVDLPLPFSLTKKVIGLYIVNSAYCEVS